MEGQFASMKPVQDRLKGRYLTLDAMRGLAAIAVALFHFRTTLAPEAYLAVDFFFALSGFVLTKAYADRLHGTISAGRFMKMRFVRLYPMFLIGLMLGFGWDLQRTARHALTSLTWLQLGGSGLVNLVMIPSPFTATFYPFNSAFWSVAAELVVNLAFATVLIRLRRRWLAALALTSGAALIVLVRPPAFADGGVEWTTLWLGLDRTFFSFLVGYMLATMTADRVRPSTIASLPILMALCGILFARPGLCGHRVFDLVAIGLAFPVLLHIGARLEPPLIGKRLAAFLGDISYPLYAIHEPVRSVMAYFGSRHPWAAGAVLPGFLVISLVMAAGFEHVLDKRIRHWLTRRLALRRSAEPQLL